MGGQILIEKIKKFESTQILLSVNFLSPGGVAWPNPFGGQSYGTVTPVTGVQIPSGALRKEVVF